VSRKQDVKGLASRMVDTGTLGSVNVSCEWHRTERRALTKSSVNEKAGGTAGFVLFSSYNRDSHTKGECHAT